MTTAGRYRHDEPQSQPGSANIPDDSIANIPDTTNPRHERREDTEKTLTESKQTRTQEAARVESRVLWSGPVRSGFWHGVDRNSVLVRFSLHGENKTGIEKRKDVMASSFKQIDF